MPAPGQAIDCGSAYRGYVPGAAMPCKPRAAPAGAGCRPGLGWLSSNGYAQASVRNLRNSEHQLSATNGEADA